MNTHQNQLPHDQAKKKYSPYDLQHIFFFMMVIYGLIILGIYKYKSHLKNKKAHNFEIVESLYNIELRDSSTSSLGSFSSGGYQQYLSQQQSNPQIGSFPSHSNQSQI